MFVILLSLLLIITLYFLFFNFIKSSKKSLAIFAVIFVMTGIGLFSSSLLSYLESYSIVSHPIWKQHNAIILLGAGTVKLPDSNEIKPSIMAYSRIYEAARLYTSCKKTNTECKIITSGGDALGTGKSEAVIYQNELNAIGVNQSDIILEPNSMNTFKNAEFTSIIFKSNKFDNVYLVTSGIHMKRALLYFSHFGINAIPAVSDYIPPKIFMIPLGFNFAITDFAIHEYLGILRFRIYNYLGLNTNPAKPGAL
jgi:uncharacterized SAM-binding protein YcdF (DUF218 family)